MAKVDDTFELLDSLDEVLRHLSLDSKRDKLVTPSQVAIREIRKELPKALCRVPRGKRVKPPGEFRGNARRCPPMVVAVSELIDQLVIVGYHQTTVKWAIYQAVEAGLLGSGLQTHVVLVPRSIVKRRLRLKAPKNPEPTNPELNQDSSEDDARQTGVGYQIHSLWIWPTQRMVKSHSSLKEFAAGKHAKKRGPTIKYDPEADEKIFTMWKLKPRKWKKYADLALELGLTTEQVAKTIDRHRNGKKSKKVRPRRSSD